MTEGSAAQNKSSGRFDHVKLKRRYIPFREVYPDMTQEERDIFAEGIRFRRNHSRHPELFEGFYDENGVRLDDPDGKVYF